MTLGSYLEALVSIERLPGVHDCVTLPADWALACGRPDPARRWRGAYRTDEEASVIIAQDGGLAALFALGMEDAGIPEVSVPPLAGDIGVIDLMGFEAGAIFTGRRWAFVPASRGLGFVSLDASAVRRAWRP